MAQPREAADRESVVIGLAKANCSLRSANAIVVAFFTLMVSAPVMAGTCTGNGIELQVLGSGGPELLGDRALTSYVIRLDGRASLLIARAIYERP